jgi:hypothetical protein
MNCTEIEFTRATRLTARSAPKRCVAPHPALMRDLHQKAAPSSTSCSPLR